MSVVESGFRNLTIVTYAVFYLPEQSDESRKAGGGYTDQKRIEEISGGGAQVIRGQESDCGGLLEPAAPDQHPPALQRLLPDLEDRTPETHSLCP